MEEGTGQESRVFRRVRDLCYPTKKKEKKKKEPFWVFSFFKELVLFIPVSLGLGRKVAFGY